MIAADTVRAWKRATAAGEGGYTSMFRAQVQSPHGDLVPDQVPVIDCQWSWDGASTRPLSGTVTVPAIDWSDPAAPVDWRPTHTRAALVPFGNRLVVDAGVDAGYGPVWVRLGVGLIRTVDYQRPEEVLRVTVSDLGDEFDQAKTVTDFTLVEAVTVRQLLDVLRFGAHLPYLPAVADPGGLLARTVPAGRTWAPGTSLWDVLQDGVRAADPAASAWFDRDGQLRFGQLTLDTARPPGQQLAARPDWALRTGDGGHVLGLQSSLTRDGAVNLVAVAVEDSEVIDPEYADADTTPEDDWEGMRRKEFEAAGMSTIGGSGSNMAVSKPSGRTAGFTDKPVTPPRWPFATVAGHPMGATFGQHGAVWWNNTHYGTDFSAPSGGTVVAVCQGRIVQIGGSEAGWAGPHYVVQQASDGSRFYYCHLASAAVKVGQFLLRGDSIGQAGDLGKAFGIHLHLERRKPPYQMPGSCVDWRGGGPVK